MNAVLKTHIAAGRLISYPVPAWDDLPSLTWADKVALLTFLSLEGVPQEVCPVNHLFEGGDYIRELRIPEGTLMTGRAHSRGHLMQLTKGSAVLVAPDGKFVFHAPAELTTKPGFQAVAFMLTDVICRTVHPNPAGLRDIDALENEWFAPAQLTIDRGRVIAGLLNRAELPPLRVIAT